MPGLINSPNKRHREIAEIASHLGANVSPRDIQIVCEAIKIEYEERHNIDTDNMSIKALCENLDHFADAGKMVTV